MSEILRTPEKLRLHGICKIPAGKAGKAAAKQYANERKARIRALSRLAEADKRAGVGLLVMLNSADRELGRYIFKKLDKVIPFYVRVLSDGTSGMPAEEMGWLMEACEKRGYRTLWLDLTGTEKIDKKAVLHLVAGELVRLLEGPAPERVSEEALTEAEVEHETAVVEAALEMAGVEVETEGAEESTIKLEESIERVDVEIDTEEPIENTDVEIIQEEPCKKADTVQEETLLSAEKEAGAIVESYAVQAGPETEEKTETANEVAESPVVVEEILTTEEKPTVTEKPATEEPATEEPTTEEPTTEEPTTEESATEEAPAVEAKPAEEKKSAAEEKTVTEDRPAVEENLVTEEKPAPRRRSRKTSSKPEGEKTPTKPRRKRAPAAPLTVEATLAKRRRQMGLE